jgi:hypothetical protein
VIHGLEYEHGQTPDTVIFQPKFHHSLPRNARRRVAGGACWRRCPSAHSCTCPARRSQRDSPCTCTCLLCAVRVSRRCAPLTLDRKEVHGPQPRSSRDAAPTESTPRTRLRHAGGVSAHARTCLRVHAVAAWTADGCRSRKMEKTRARWRAGHRDRITTAGDGQCEQLARRRTRLAAHLGEHCVPRDALTARVSAQSGVLLPGAPQGSSAGG